MNLFLSPGIRLFGLVVMILATCCQVQGNTVHLVAKLDALTAIELRDGLQQGHYSASQVSKFFLQRIRDIDDAGPTLNAVVEINPDALAIAAQLDQSFNSNGVVGPLHGLPILLKANIDTGDHMATSAGSIVLAKHLATKDAFFVQQLRAAGAIILGKANLSEWANFRSTASSSGWSSLGGQTKNAHVLDRNPCGSSSGSAVGVAASLAPLAVGTETDGSIVCPASLNGIVGIKPTVGVVSRIGIIPISHTQDTAGPMAKTVLGAALLLQSMVGFDPVDGKALKLPEAADLLPKPSSDGLSGIRLGVLRTHLGAGFSTIEPIFDQAMADLRTLGAQLVDPLPWTPNPQVRQAEYQVFLFEFKAGLNRYLAQHQVAEDRDTLSEIVTLNRRDADKIMPLFKQEIFLAAQAKGTLQELAYHEALANSGVKVRILLDNLFREHQLHAIVVPSNSPAWKTDWLYGDNSNHGVFSSAFAAISGYPSITVPAGYVSKLPVGISFIGPALSEAQLIQIAYSYEQATQARRPPQFIPSLEP